MPGPIDKQSIISACLTGIENAQAKQIRMSGGYWLSWAPEYLITTEIAESIHGTPGTKYVTLENHTRAALEDARALGKGRLHPDIRVDGRVDIVLRWANYSPRAIIEVKNRVHNIGHYESDIKRLKQILSRKRMDNSLQFAIFAFYTEYQAQTNDHAEGKIASKLFNIEKNIGSILGAAFSVENKHRWFPPEDGTGWCAVCMVINKN